ncbi:MAG: NADH-quinone oxidoreductase subunit H [Candidatus Micrarchaeota archaeon]
MYWYERLVVAVLVVAGSFVLEGFRRKMIARMQTRRGPPLLQPVYDMLKLLEKKSNVEVSALARVLPVLALICALAIALLLPYSFLRFDYDFVLLGYLFALLCSLQIGCALASRSPLAFQAAAREMALMLGYLGCFFLVILLFLAKGNVVSMKDYALDLAVIQMPIASFILLWSGRALLRIAPYDAVNADVEISSGLFSEFSGKEFAFLEAAEFIKNFAFYWIASFLMFGKYMLFGLALLLVINAVVQATSARYSTKHALRNLLLFSLIAFVDFVVLKFLGIG